MSDETESEVEFSASEQAGEWLSDAVAAVGFVAKTGTDSQRTGFVKSLYSHGECWRCGAPVQVKGSTVCGRFGFCDGR